MRGFTLLEVLIAALLFSLTLLGLLRYQQVLAQQLVSVQAQQQAWFKAHSLLERCAVVGRACLSGNNGEQEERRYRLEWQPQSHQCEQVEIRVNSPWGYEARL